MREQLERKALKSMDMEYRLKAHISRDGSWEYHKNDPRYLYYAQLSQTLLEVLSTYEFLLRELYRAIEYIDATAGRLKSADEMQEEVRLILDLMEEIDYEPVEKLAEKAKWDLPDWFTYLKPVQEIQEQIKQEFDAPIYYHAFLKWALAQHRFQRVKSYPRKKYYLRDAYFWEEALREDLGEEPWEAIQQRACALLDQLIRSSSMVETVNSRLRPFLDEARGQVNQNRLNLIRFVLNHKVYQRGKRKGQSAHQLYFKTKCPKNWIDAMKEKSETFRQISMAA